MVCMSFVIFKQYTYNHALVTSSNPTSVSSNTWEETTGLLSSLIPQAPNSETKFTNPQAFNASKGELKLGPAPITDELRTEMEKSLREHAMIDRDPAAQYDIQLSRPTPLPGVVAPSESDLLPHPPTFKTVDIEREVNAVRDARRRIRLDPTHLHNIDPNSPQLNALKGRALPSICAYTLYDVPEG
jgi:transcription initiation factor TFIID subunit 5